MNNGAVCEAPLRHDGVIFTVAGIVLQRGLLGASQQTVQGRAGPKLAFRLKARGEPCFSVEVVIRFSGTEAGSDLVSDRTFAHANIVDRRGPSRQFATDTQPSSALT